jgi:hypothetical protein
MKKRKSPTAPSEGTAILGKVIPELVITGVFNVTDTEAQYLAKGITTAILAQFQLDLLHASGLLAAASED